MNGNGQPPAPAQQPVTQQLSPQDFATRIRTKYPGAYDDLSDADLTQKVLTKYPQYSDMVSSASTAAPSQIYQRPPGTAGAAVSAQPSNFQNWLQNAEADVRYGGARTAIGSVLSALGAQGTNVGAQAGAGGTLASPVLGAVHTAQGLAMTPQHPLMGTAKTLGGMAEASTLPLAFAGGPIAGGAAEAIPSKAAAGQAIQDVTNAAGQVPINVEGPGQVALRVQQLAQRGASMPKVVRNFLTRVTDPEQGPVTFEEARDFYNNATRLSANEYQKLAPVVQRQLGQFVDSMHGALVGAADTVGMGQKYDNAIGEYATASGLQRGAKGFAQWFGQNIANRMIPYGVGSYILKQYLNR